MAAVTDDARLRRFFEFLTHAGLRATRQRRMIARAFFDADRHLSAEELYHRIYAQEPGIGLTTVYRTLKLMRDAELATGCQFGDAYLRFDPSPADRPHSHLICTRCGNIQEFQDRALLHLRQRAERSSGFAVRTCKLELYGLCRDCARRGPGGTPPAQTSRARSAPTASSPRPSGSPGAGARERRARPR